MNKRMGVPGHTDGAGNVSPLRIGSLFSGIGGLDLAVEEHFQARTVWHCEYDEKPSKVLALRWPGVPNLGDITTVDWSTVEPVDIICGGSPCQDVSAAGPRTGMVDGTRSNLWVQMREAVAYLKPSVVIWENVSGALSAYAFSSVESEPGLLGEHGPDRPALRAAGRVVGDLSALGYDAIWTTLPASAVGAPHRRERVFVIAYARGLRLGEGWDAASREATAGWASTVPGGRSGAPLTLLPTPDASNANDGEGLDTWLERRERVKAKGINGNGRGMPLAIAALKLIPTPTAQDAAESAGSSPSNVTLTDAVLRTQMGTRPNPRHKLLPTPQVADATGGHASRSGDRSDELLLPGVAAQVHANSGLLPTPRASRGASSTEIMLALGAEVDYDGDRQGNVTGEVSWGEYEPAVRRWEAVTRPVPDPTRPDGKNGRHRISPLLPEWMMGYLAGWVTDVIDREAAIRACGNGVVPQQALFALRIMWPRVVASLLGVAA